MDSLFEAWNRCLPCRDGRHDECDNVTKNAHAVDAEEFRIYCLCSNCESAMDEAVGS